MYFYCLKESLIGIQVHFELLCQLLLRILCYSVRVFDSLKEVEQMLPARAFLA
jgi:hypothetical protein